jgi:hypothetical protein
MADFWENCQKHSDVCITAILVGVIVTLLILWIYTKYNGGSFLSMEHFDSSLQQTLLNNMKAARGLGLSSEHMAKAKNYR